MSRATAIAFRCTSIAAVSFVAVGMLSLPASASIVDDGEWYISGYEIPEFHDQGIDGSGVTIAVFDDAINTDVPALHDANLEVMPDSLCADSDGNLQPVDTDDLDLASHGTNNVLKISGTGKGYSGQDGITGVAPGATVLFYGLGMPIEDPCFAPGDGAVTYVDAVIPPAIVDAVDRGARILSFSSALGGSQQLDDALTYAIRKQVIVLAATPNDSTVLGSEALNLFNGVMGVGSFDRDGVAGLDSNGDPNRSTYIDVVAPGQDVALQGADGKWNLQRIGSGTSYATPVTAGNLALAMQKFPDATGNQILQLLLHNTDVDAPHEIYFDSTFLHGYGSVDTINLLAGDPSLYPDTNPLLEEDGIPSPAELTVTASPSPSASPTTTPPASGATSESGSSALAGWVWPLIIVAVAFFIVVGIFVTLVMVRRNRRK